MAESTTIYQWPFFAAGAVVLSALIVRRNYNLQLKSLGKLQRENTQLKNEIELLKKQIDLLQEKIRDQENNHHDNSFLKEIQLELDSNRKQKEHFEKSLSLLQKQERDWLLQKEQLSHDNTNLKETLAKLQKLTEENNLLKNQLHQREQESLTAALELKTRLDEFKSKYEESSLQLSLSNSESVDLKNRVASLENTITIYKQQIEEEKNRIATIKLEDSINTPRSTTSMSTNNEEEEPPSYTNTPRSITTEEEEEEEEELELPPSYTSKELDLPDVALDLINKIPTSNKKDLLKELEQQQQETGLDKKEVTEEEEMFDLSKLKKGSSSKKLKTPAFMSIFADTSNSEDSKQNSKAIWSSGSGVIVEYGVKEDINSKGKKGRSSGGGSSRKGFSFGGTGGVKDMEDTNLICYPFPNETSPSSMALFCVFDGHGGADCAKEAKKIFPTTLENKIQSIVVSENCNQILRETFLEVDSKLEEFEYLGCTATSVFIWEFNGNRYLQAANVGDSTAFIKRSGITHWLTKDHKASSEEERARIIAEGGELTSGQTRVMGGLAVSRALGDHFLKKETVGFIADPYICPPILLSPGDTTVILASDGLWDVMTGEEAMNTIEHIEDASTAARHLVSTATSNPKCTDNITVIVVFL